MRSGRRPRNSGRVGPGSSCTKPKFSLERIGPAVVGAPQRGGPALLLGGHRRRVVAAYVEEGAQAPVPSPHDNERLARHLGGEELARLPRLVEPSHHLPAAEDGLLLQLVDLRVHVPRGGNGERLREGRIGVVVPEDVVEGGGHFFPITQWSNHSTLRVMASSISFGSWIPWGWRG